MKFWVPVFYDLTADTWLFSSLVDFSFLFIDSNAAFCISAHQYFVTVFQCPFIFWGRCCFRTGWLNISRISTAIACALSQVTFFLQTCLPFFFFLFLCPLSFLVLFPEIYFFSHSRNIVLVVFIMSSPNIKSLGH